MFKFVLYILGGGFISEGFNYFNVVFILKKNKVIRLIEFRFISLCNVVFKLVIKCFVNRLKIIFSIIISEN